MASKLNQEALKSFVSENFDKTIIPTLEEYIKIPSLSPMFDEQVHTNGLQEKVVELLVQWVKSQQVPGLKVEVVKDPKCRTPVIFIEVEATQQDCGTILLYGHFDKQPPFTGWAEDLGPYTPVIKDKDGEPWLYGRGGADDGYSIFSSVTAIRALKEQNIPHGKCVILIEGSEESGSPDLPTYINTLKDRIGNPNYIICLDSGAGNYKQLWVTTSLRGITVGELIVNSISEGVHSGSGSGVIADTFRVARMLLSRIEDEKTGRVLLPDLYTEIPRERLDQVKVTADVLGKSFVESYPLLSGASATEDDLEQLMLNRTWRPMLTVTGADGLPSVQAGGNVLRPMTALKLSMRLPPHVNATKAAQAIKHVLEKDPPYGFKVTYNIKSSGSGWDAPALAEWVSKSVQSASHTYYGKEACFQGEGGSIPFMGMLGEAFPKAQFLITGVLGPNSNAHGPNEGMNIPFTKKLTCCITAAIADHALVKNE